MFKLCFDNDTMKLICIESMKHAAQKGDSRFTLSVDDLFKYFGILLFSGYNKMPFRRMYWQTRPDANCYFASQSISRNKFEKIHQFLLFNDNSNIDETYKVFKIRPLLIHLNDFFHQSFLPLSKSYSLDEAMEPYYGHHAMKQFIRGKPIRYGFKFWRLKVNLLNIRFSYVFVRFLRFCFSLTKYALFHPHFYVSISALTRQSHTGQKFSEKNFL